MCGVPGVWAERSRRGRTAGHCVGAEQRESVGSRGFAGGRERGRFGVTWGQESLWDLGGVSSLGETWRGSTLALGGVGLR